MGITAFVICFSVLAFVEIAAGLILNKFLKKEKQSDFIQELPKIRLPSVKAVLKKRGVLVGEGKTLRAPLEKTPELKAHNNLHNPFFLAAIFCFFRRNHCPEILRPNTIYVKLSFR